MLTAIGIKKAVGGKLFDSAGLSLVKSGDSGKWIYRYTVHGKRREMGLGAWPAVSLAEARKSRDGWAAEVRQGRDPITVRDAARQAESDEARRTDPTFADMVTVVFNARKATLRGDGVRGRWRSPLDTHIIPAIGQRPISQISVRDVQDAFAPIWHSKPTVARKAFLRTRLVFTKAKLMGHACDPFTVEAAKEVLGVVDYQPTHIAATPWQDIPALYAKLGTGGNVAQCLRFMILTLVRSDAARGASLDEIDGDIWTVPPDRVKGLKGKVSAFRVPLSTEAQEIAAQQAEICSGLMFTGPRGKPVSSNGLEKHLTALGEAGRPHGFRTSFRTWVQDTDACSWEVAETILGHTINSRVARSYARSDLLERRRIALDAWSAFVTGQASASVTVLRG